jgi:hypothetical protein
VTHAASGAALAPSGVTYAASDVTHAASDVTLALGLVSSYATLMPSELSRVLGGPREYEGYLVTVMERTGSAYRGEDVAGAGWRDDGQDDRRPCHRVEYARLVRKGGDVKRSVHGPEVGYYLQTPMQNAASLCQGLFAGYDAHFESLSFGARIAGCHAGFSNDVLQASVDQFGGELRLRHAWDLPVVSVDLGMALGAWLFEQTFVTRGMAPPRTTGAGSLAFGVGIRGDVVLGFALFAESSFVSFLYPQEDDASDSAVSVGPHFAFRQAFGLAKVW